ncbi:OB-fold domain-containing protein [Actinophytocola sp.]|uniref:Zn-ribbon domain-containing OB-fold protein n=1 Tax=Actinophytocola sp. TaxID=1872138 RepID=UPI0025BD8B1F|nr:OB-fold domain-containing protein [Actinophytocola sp.]
MTTVTNPARPLPTPTDLTRPFWAGLAEGALRLQRCVECGHLRNPIATVCPECLSADHAWEQVSGLGTVFSTIVFHQVYNEAFATDVPYNVSIVELDEGPHVLSNVVGKPPGEVRVGDRVRVVLTEVAPGVTIHQFRPDGDGAA